MKKILIFMILFITIFTLNVNATTYFGDKKAEFFEIGETKNSAIVKYNGKYYNFNDNNDSDITNDNFIEMKIENNILTKTEATEDYDTIMKSIFSEQKYTYYDYGEDDKFYAFTYSETEVTKNEVSIDLSNLTYINQISDKLYFIDNNNYSFIKIYNTDGTPFKEITSANLKEKVNLNAYEGKNTLEEIYALNVDGEPFYELIIKINEQEKIVKTLGYFFDQNLNLIFNFEENTTSQNIIFPTITKTNSGYKLLYSDCRDLTNGIEGCTVKVQDENKKETDIITATGQTMISNDYGLIVINALDKDLTKSTSYIYDNNLNLIKTYKGANRAYLSIVIKDLETFNTVGQASVQLKPNDFTIRIEYSDNDNNITTKYELMNIEIMEKVNITGSITQEDEADLKNYIIELHSISTYKLESDGYFKFDNVKEGKHTLIVNDSKGNKIAEKEINIIVSTETKLDGSTLYFNPNDNGVNLNIKISTNELTITSINKGNKDKPTKMENIIETIIPNVPETSDSLYLYISLFAILSIFSIIVIKNIKKMKNK